MKQPTELAGVLGVTMENPALLSLALTHPSVNNQDNNQRLEFLGDAVVQLCVSRRLYFAYPSCREGKLTRLRQSLVCEHALACMARSICLGDYLILDKGSRLNGLANLESVLCDAMEAVLGAIYLDRGLDAAARIIDRLWPGDETALEDPKSLLQERVQALGLPFPVYETLSAVGPDNAKTFTVRVLVDGQEYATGQDTSKKRAEQQAACRALKQGKFEKK